MKNSDKIILDLCGGTGAWSRPYKEAGYNVKNITLPKYNVKEYSIWKDIMCFRGQNGAHKIEFSIKNVYGILSAPPCQMFSFARTDAKEPRDLEEGMKCVRACLDIIWRCMEIKQDTIKKTLPLQFWALENPYHGFLRRFLGKPIFIFDPWEFGDGYQKKTALWGYFNEPKKNPIPMTEEMKKLAKTNSYLHTMKNSTNRGKPPSIWAKKDLEKFDILKSKDIHPEKFGELNREERRAITSKGFAEAFFRANQ